MKPMPLWLDVERMHRVGGQLGSNPAGVYEDAAGRRYYVKTLESPALARNEWLAAQLYRLAGAPTLRYLPTRSPCQVATVWIELDARSVARLTEAQRRQAQHWLGVHAWTANWDVAGSLGDNQGVKDGAVLTLDLGGALAFRAQGDPKGQAFGPQVAELDRLRRDPDNPHARALFGDMSEAAVQRAIRVVTDIPDVAIRDCVLTHGGTTALADLMVARKDDMVLRLMPRAA